MISKREAFRNAFIDLNDKMIAFFKKYGFKQDDIRLIIDEYDFVSVSVPHDLTEEIVAEFETNFNVTKTVRVQETVTDYTVPDSSTITVYRYSFVPSHLYEQQQNGVDTDAETENE